MSWCGPNHEPRNSELALLNVADFSERTELMKGWLLWNSLFYRRAELEVTAFNVYDALKELEEGR